MTAAASSIYSTPADMGRNLAALLAGGSGEHDTILKPETLAMMFAPQYQPDPRIPGMGLAFFRVDLGGPWRPSPQMRQGGRVISQ